MKTIISLPIIALLFACNANKTNSDETDAGSAENPADSITAATAPKCYQYTGRGDTIALQMVQNGEMVTGTLLYHLREKDKNEGAFRGEIKNNILIADYTFTSEGMQSVRQIAFKIADHSLTEGYGDIETKDNRAYFKNPEAIAFPDTMPLLETGCK